MPPLPMALPRNSSLFSVLPLGITDSLSLCPRLAICKLPQSNRVNCEVGHVNPSVHPREIVPSDLPHCGLYQVASDLEAIQKENRGED